MKLISGILLLVGFFYLFWTGAMAVRSYWQMSDVVDRAFELQERARAGAPVVRQAVLAGASEVGVPISAEDVVVTDDAAATTVRLRWSWPVVSWKGEQVVRVPLSLERVQARR